ncbi:MAG: hypothetical protein ABIZ04_05035 [Opitutus sp.]
MKLVPLLFGLSLVANAALLVVVYCPASELNSERTSSVPIAPALRASTNGERGTEAKSVAQPVGEASVSWSKLQNAKLADVVAQLRAAGFSAAAIRAIVYARLDEQMAEQRKRLLTEFEDPPFWKTKRPMFNSKLMMAQREFYQEQKKQAKEILGSDAVGNDPMAEYFRKRQYGDITAEKEEKLQRVAGDYGDLTNTIYADTNGILMPEDRDKIVYLEKEMRKDMAEILTPAEMENYELRSSSTANELRSQLTTFQPDEAEFRGLFHAMRTVEEKYGNNQMGMTPDQRQQRTAALNEQAKLALSPERFAQFEQATNPANSSLNRIVARYNLPETVVPQVNAVQKDIQQRAAALRQLPAAEQTAQAQALQKEATGKLQPLLGDSAFRAYKIFGGQWLDQITRPMPTGPANSGPAGAPKAASR